MPRISSESKERVREAVDVVELINRHTDLRRNGSQYMGRCPFHEDNSPSFSVNPVDKVYYCFGCQASGDVFTFVMEKEALDFAGAIEYLADMYNVELEYEDLDPAAAARQQARDRLIELLERATRFYERTLSDSPEASAAREYLAERGFSAAVVEKFRLGYAPKAWDKLFVPALAQGFSEQEMLDAGLVQRNSRGQIHDRFRGRIMFPLADKKGVIRGFGARGMRESDRPKYLNSPEGPVYRKGEQVFGIDHARRPAAARKRVIAVEGYADVLALHDAGFEEAVAVMGTAMTERQAAQLSRMAPRVLIALDADQSGRRAALRASQMLSAQGDCETLVIEIPEGKDPDELIKQGGPKAFEAAIEAAVTVPEFAVAQVFAEGDLADARGRQRVLDDLVPVIAVMPSGPSRDEQIRIAADRLGVSDAVLRESIRTRAESRARPGPEGGGKASTPRDDPAERVEQTFISQCLSNPGIGRDFLNRVDDEHLSTALMRELRDHLRVNFEHPLEGVSQLRPELARAVTRAAMFAEAERTDDAIIELGYLQLEKACLERSIATAPGRQKGAIELQRQEVISRIGELSAEVA